MQSLIRDNRAHQIPTTIEISSKDGMITMDKALKQLYNKNLITRQTLKLIARNPELV